jgi:hypothetical protein
VGPKDVAGRVVPGGAGRQEGLPVPVQALHRDDGDVPEPKLRGRPLLPAEEALDHHHPLQLHPPQVPPTCPHRYVVGDVPSCTVPAQKHPAVVHIRRQVSRRLLTFKPLQRPVTVLIRHRKLKLRRSPAAQSQHCKIIFYLIFCNKMRQFHLIGRTIFVSRCDQ